MINATQFICSYFHELLHCQTVSSVDILICQTFYERPVLQVHFGSQVRGATRASRKSSPATPSPPTLSLRRWLQTWLGTPRDLLPSPGKETIRYLGSRSFFCQTWQHFSFSVLPDLDSFSVRTISSMTYSYMTKCLVWTIQTNTFKFWTLNVLLSIRLKFKTLNVY